MLRPRKKPSFATRAQAIELMRLACLGYHHDQQCELCNGEAWLKMPGTTRQRRACPQCEGTGWRRPQNEQEPDCRTVLGLSQEMRQAERQEPIVHRPRPGKTTNRVATESEIAAVARLGAYL